MLLKAKGGFVFSGRLGSGRLWFSKENEYGQTIRCVKFTDQISVKYSPDPLTRALTKAPKLDPPRINTSSSHYGGPSVSTVRPAKSECPEGTLAIREIKREEVERWGSVRDFLNRGGHGRRPSRRNVDPQDGMEHQHSVERFDSPDAARPNVAPDAEISLSKIWINNENEGKLETIEIGWIASLLDALAHGANQFHGEGEVSHNSKTPGPMTVTDIGSGHFPWKAVTFAMGHTNVLSWWG